MYILGSVIDLDAGERRIPVPWWHRAALGFESGTQVYVSITHSQGDRPGDLLVSVLNINKWDQNIAVSCLHRDEPGVIEQALEDVNEWNIALAETITVEGGRLHRVDLICEPYRLPVSIVSDSHIATLREHLSAKFDGVQIRRFPPLSTEIAWSRLGTLESGWITFPGHSGGQSWRDILAGQLAELGASDKFDTQKLVLSGDTSGRLFRGVVPRKGAVMVSIEHADEPKVLQQIAEALRHAGVNVLSSLLKRGGAAPRNAILVAVCEPTPQKPDIDLKLTIDEAFSALPQHVRPLWNIRGGLSPEAVTYGRHPDDVVAHVPSHLRARVVERRAKFRTGKLPVFLSRRFLASDRPRQYAEKIRETLEQTGCEIVEAEVLPGGTRTSMDEVSAAMWAARAGIVLGVEPAPGESDVAFSLNLAHEFGFMQGQGKPLLLLVEAPSKVEAELDTWSNLKGVTAPRFSRDHALSDDRPDSLKSMVEKWVSRIVRARPNSGLDW